MYLLWSSPKTRLAACWQVKQRDGWHFRLAMKLIIRRICAKSRRFVFGLHFVILWSFRGARVSTVGYCAGGLLWERSRVRFPGGSLKSLFRLLFFPCSFKNRFRTESWILANEKVWKFAQQFSRPGKRPENGVKVWKNGKKSWHFFRFGQILFNVFSTFAAHREKSFIPAFFRGLYWSPIWQPWVWKKKLLFWKKVWKTSWILDPKICTNPASNLIPVKWGTYFGRGG